MQNAGILIGAFRDFWFISVKKRKYDGISTARFFLVTSALDSAVALKVSIGPYFG